MKLAVAGTGYVGLSMAVLLSQHHEVVAVDIITEKVELINNRKSPIVDNEIEEYLATKELNLRATLDAKEAYTDAEFVVIAAPLFEEIIFRFGVFRCFVAKDNKKTGIIGLIVTTILLQYPETLEIR